MTPQDANSAEERDGGLERDLGISTFARCSSDAKDGRVLSDRDRFGYVVDVLDVNVGPHHWSTFNVADSATSGRNQMRGRYCHQVVSRSLSKTF